MMLRFQDIKGKSVVWAESFSVILGFLWTIKYATLVRYTLRCLKDTFDVWSSLQKMVKAGLGYNVDQE